MMLVAYAYFADRGRDLYLYDTFAGMTEPSEIDVDFDNVAYKPRWTQITSQGGLMGFGDNVEGVKDLLRTGYPKRQMQFIVGDVLTTIPATLPSRISLLRLDTDWYESTRHELEHLYELLVPHGVLIIDDYGWCRGSRKVTDEFFQGQPFKPMMHRVDQGPRVLSSRILRKCRRSAHRIYHHSEGVSFCASKIALGEIETGVKSIRKWSLYFSRYFERESSGISLQSRRVAFSRRWRAAA